MASENSGEDFGAVGRRVNTVAQQVLKKGISCFNGLSMNGNLLMNSKEPPFALSLVEG